MQKYQQLAFEIRELRVGFLVEIVPLVIGCLGGRMETLEEQMKKLIKRKSRQQWVEREMQKTILMESETILKKIMPGAVQVEYTITKDNKYWYL